MFAFGSWSCCFSLHQNLFVALILAQRGRFRPALASISSYSAISSIDGRSILSKFVIEAMQKAVEWGFVAFFTWRRGRRVMERMQRLARPVLRTLWTETLLARASISRKKINSIQEDTVSVGECKYVCPQFAMSRISEIQNQDGCPVSLLCRGHKQQPAALEDLPSDCTQQLPDHVDSSAPICPADSPS